MIFPKEPEARNIESNFNDDHIKELGTFGAHDPSIFKDGEYFYKTCNTN